MQSKYLIIYNEMKKKILSGVYNDLMPSEALLVKEYDASRNTVRRAIEMLIDEGYAVSKHGKGVFILEQNNDNFLLGGVESFGEVVKRTGKKFETDVIFFEEVLINNELAESTLFPKNTVATNIHRVRKLDGERVIVDINYFSYELTKGLSEQHAGESIYAYLEGEKELDIKLSKRKITVEPVTPFVANLLDLKGYTMVAILQNHVYLSDGQLLEYTTSYHRPDVFSFVDNSTRKKS